MRRPVCILMGVWCTVTEYAPDGRVRVEWSLRGPGEPGLSVVDDLAQLRLAVRRRGGRLVLSEVSAELADLLDLCGLRRQLLGEPERGEDPCGVEEAVVLGDPTSG